MIKKSPRLASIDGDAVVKEALRRIEQPARRMFLRRSLTLGGLSLLTGCAIIDEDSVEPALMKVSRFNDKVQGWLFDPKRLAPTYPESMITRPFPFNAYYGEDEVPQVDADSYRLEVSGLVADRHAWTLPELHACRRPTRSRATSASKAGAPSANGAACRSRISSPASARTPAPSTSASSAPTITTPASTCRPRCTRRHC